MSRTETALKPLVENSSSAAARIASRKFGLRAEVVLLGGLAGHGLYFCTKDKVWSTITMGASTDA